MKGVFLLCLIYYRKHVNKKEKKQYFQKAIAIHFVIVYNMDIQEHTSKHAMKK